MGKDKIWKPIPGFEGFYEVSNFGEVRGVSRIDCGGRTRPPRVKRAQVNDRGYRYLSLYRDRKAKGFRISRLVLLAFVGPCPDGMEAAHNNGDPADDRLENLRWDTHAQNCADKIEHGTAHAFRGEDCHFAKLTETDIERIFDMHRAGCLQKDIAAWIGVGRPQISTILSGKSWSHLRMPSAA